MNAPEDTIAAVATAVGQGGIGIVRLSGRDAVAFAGRIFSSRNGVVLEDVKSRSLVYGSIIDKGTGAMVDEVLVSVMRAPRSYTREDVVEVNCHGGLAAVRRVLQMVLDEGARLAEPGEFTKRAFLNGRIDLSQAEAVLDLIEAKTDESRRIAAEQLSGGLSGDLQQMRDVLIGICAQAEAHIDFPEEDIERQTADEMIEKMTACRTEMEKLSATFEDARFFRDGLSVAIVGRPNVGKSSLLNALLRQDRAIVTEIPGTTRDLIEDFVNINGLPVRIVDTAGIRRSSETVEQEGIRRSVRMIEHADFVLALFDGSEPLVEEDREILSLIRTKKALIVVNKADLTPVLSHRDFEGEGKAAVSLSVRTGQGLEALRTHIVDANVRNWPEEREGIVVTSVRHKNALDRSAAALGRAIRVLSGRGPLEIFVIELREAADCIGEITGAVTSEDILDRIFRDFCIGK